MRQTVILPYTPQWVTQEDRSFLRKCLTRRRSGVALRSFDIKTVPVWLGDPMGLQTVTITLNSEAAPEVFEFVPGPKFFARRASKADLLKTLIAAGISTPHSAIMTAESTPFVADFGPYLAIKTTAPGTTRAVGIHVVRTSDFSDLRTQILERYAQDIARGYWPVMQQYIPTGQRPTHTRVTTFLGEPIVCFSTTAPNDFDLTEFSGIAGGEATSNFSAKRTRKLVDDPPMLDLARQVATVLPETAVLSTDMVRCAETGKLYCIETNLGNLSTLSAPITRSLQRELGHDALHRQFGSYDTMAKRILTVLDEATTGPAK